MRKAALKSRTSTLTYSNPQLPIPCNLHQSTNLPKCSRSHRSSATILQLLSKCPSKIRLVTARPSGPQHCEACKCATKVKMFKLQSWATVSNDVTEKSVLSLPVEASMLFGILTMNIYISQAVGFCTTHILPLSDSIATLQTTYLPVSLLPLLGQRAAMHIQGCLGIERSSNKGRICNLRKIAALRPSKFGTRCSHRNSQISLSNCLRWVQ